MTAAENRKGTALEEYMMSPRLQRGPSKFTAAATGAYNKPKEDDKDEQMTMVRARAGKTAASH